MAKTKYIESTNCYVYAHIRQDKNEPFYIGIGSQRNHKRAFNTKDRNNLWQKIFNKCVVTSNILYDGLTWAEACEIEQTLIGHFGRLNNNTGILVNLTDGGEGGYGRVLSDECRKKIGDANKGRPSPFRGSKCKDELKEKISIAVKAKFAKMGGNPSAHRKHSPETILKLKNRVYKDEWKQKVSESLKARNIKK